MVDREILLRKIEALVGYVEKLRRFRTLTEAEFVSTPSEHDLAERYLHLAIEAALDIAGHVIASMGWRMPETNADSFTVLEEVGELPGDLAERLRGWARFRNALVHLYLNINHSVSYNAIQRELGDLERLAGWAEAKLS